MSEKNKLIKLLEEVQGGTSGSRAMGRREIVNEAKQDIQTAIKSFFEKEYQRIDCDLKGCGGLGRSSILKEKEVLKAFAFAFQSDEFKINHWFGDSLHSKEKEV